ncbi:TonB-dependent receptor [Shinella sp. BYT-45]|uniref:TonB-dependent receptor n=1 Tax=Shinella sp. BYT-45 TaxID=3377377 RepID=UPI00398109EA
MMTEMKGKKLRASTSVLALALTAGLVQPSFGQEADQNAATMLEPIVIYGTKRDDKAQDVPLPVTVLGAEKLQLMPKTGSNADIARSTPNFSYVDYSAQYSNVGIIRGVGSFSPLSAEDTSVVYNVDEIPRSAYSMPVTMLDMQQIEVLRGPQGTLFGRNAQGGAVNFITNTPTFDREFSLRGEVGTNGHRLGEFIANGALIDDVLAGRLAVQYTGRDGDVRNIVTGGKEGGFDVGAVRGSLLFTPDADTRAQLTFHYNKSEDNSSRFLLRDYPDFPISATNPENKFERENYGINLRFEHNFESFKFTSVSSIQQDTLDQRMDLTDGLIFSKVAPLSFDYFNTPGVDLMTYNMRDRTYFQEFRLSSLDDSPISWVAGLNYFRSEFSGKQNGDTFSIPRHCGRI